MKILTDFGKYLIRREVYRRLRKIMRIFGL